MLAGMCVVSRKKGGWEVNFSNIQCYQMVNFRHFLKQLIFYNFEANKKKWKKKIILLKQVKFGAFFTALHIETIEPRPCSFIGETAIKFSGLLIPLLFLTKLSDLSGRTQ